MAFQKLTLLINLRPKCLPVRFYMQKYEYEIPESYRNAFYLANASLEDTTNWFVHNAMGVLYTGLMEELKHKGYNVFEAKRQISSIMNLLEPCSSIIDIQFPVKRENGDYEIFRGFRAEHGLYISNRPCLGGLRLCPNIERSDVRALAAISTYKYACMGINMLGAHGGIIVSPEHLESYDLQKVVEMYALELTKRGFCGESVDIFEPDMNCGSNEMMWITAANSKVRGVTGKACAVGKPVSFGGIENREKAVAQGILYGLNIFIQDQDIMNKIEVECGWQDKTFILQGMGNAGSYTARYIASMGVKCVGIIEHDCHIYDQKGINLQEAILYKNKYGSLDGFNSMTKSSDPSAVLTAECDILLLAATQKSLPYFIADKVKAKIIIEAANGPMTPSVHKILVGRHKLVLPDVYINAGSSIASYFEYLKNIEHIPSDNAESSTNEMILNFLNLSNETPVNINSNACHGNALQWIMLDHSERSAVTIAIDNIMQQTAKDITATADAYKLGLDFRTAAYINAIKRLFWKALANLH